ncbi:unnamed protein product [Chrysodeixis includens]|uniref:Uncharacterized protein n=1 Tax=Chrysodeixis includens TaxID=689277 RepID=A0A9N8Q000_CHRIL|nr:unnamed protein product [Chrysodeixis includens]
MLKFLTHKLRTHSLNEESVSEKVGVGASRLRDVKVTPPPENGRLAREQRSGTSAGCRATRAVPIRLRPGRPARPAGPAAWPRRALAVEERDSGTESDDEADRADPGDSETPGYTSWLLPALHLLVKLSPASSGLYAV